MSEQTLETQVSEETPVSTVVETPVVIEEKRYEYQPTDEDGRPVGGKQVIKYTTQEELIFKLQEQNTQLIRKLRQQTKENRLGISKPEVIDENAQRFQGPVQFQPKPLTKEDRARLSRELLDEDTFDRAATEIFSAATGIDGTGLNTVLTDLQQSNLNLKAIIEADRFKAKNKEYIDCKENIEAIANWMTRYDLAPVQANFQKAYDTLRESDLLITSIEVIPQATYTPPVTVVETPVVLSTPVETVVSEVEVPLREEIPVENQIPLETVASVVTQPVVSRVPMSLNKGNSSTPSAVAPSTGDEIVYEFIQRDGQGRQVGAPKIFKGLAAVNAMPSEEYKRRMLTDKGFTKKVEKLEAEAAKRRKG